ncbi:MAG: hypothetical protein MJ252_30690 [archaeon]|nr:hypothetical protein [archaeon]
MSSYLDEEEAKRPRPVQKTAPSANAPVANLDGYKPGESSEYLEGAEPKAAPEEPKLLKEQISEPAAEQKEEPAPATATAPAAKKAKGPNPYLED